MTTRSRSFKKTSCGKRWCGASMSRPVTAPTAIDAFRGGTLANFRRSGSGAGASGASGTDAGRAFDQTDGDLSRTCRQRTKSCTYICRHFEYQWRARTALRGIMLRSGKESKLSRTVNSNDGRERFPPPGKSMCFRNGHRCGRR
jgi:hypothetical protein